MPCELCEVVLADPIEETVDYLVVMCPRCEMPILIWNAHNVPMDKLDKMTISSGIERAGQQVYGSGMYDIESAPCVPGDHFHIHARPRQIALDIGNRGEMIK